MNRGRAEFGIQSRQRVFHPFVDGHRAGDGNTRGAQQAFGHVLVECDGRTQDAAARERHAGDLGQALDRPVFAVESVQDGEQDVDLR